MPKKFRDDDVPLLKKVYMNDEEIEDFFRRAGGEKNFENLIVLSDLNGVSMQTICAHLGIPIPQKFPKRMDMKDVERLYYAGYTDSEIAMELNGNRVDAASWRRRNGLPNRNAKKFHKEEQ